MSHGRWVVGGVICGVVLAATLAPGVSHARTPGEPAGDALTAMPDVATAQVDGDLDWEPWFSGPGLDPGSSSGGIGGAAAMTVWDDGTGPALYVGGWTITAGGHVVNRIARWDGAEWAPLTGPGGTGVWMEGSGNPNVKALAVHDGDLIVAGFFNRAGGVSVNNIARWDGQEWSALGEGVTGSIGIESLTVHDGALIAGGRFTTAGGEPANRVARWDGAAWSPLAEGANGTVFTVASFDGSLYAGGSFTEAGGAAANRVARWDGVAWSPVDTGFDNSVYSLAGYDGDLVAGGLFTTAGDEPASRVARWDGEQWSPLGAGMDGVGNIRVLTMTTFDGALVAGGAFREADGVPVNYIAEWDGTGWSPLSGPAGTGVDNGVSAVAEFDGNLIAGSGAFRVAGGVPVNYIAQWDGTGWSALAGGPGRGLSTGGAGVASVQAMTTWNGELFVAGRFIRAGGETVNQVARWDGATWAPLPGTYGTGTTGQATALAVYDGDLIVGGRFGPNGGAGGLAVSNIARYDGQEWSPLTTPAGVGTDSGVNALAVYDGDLIVGGSFRTAGGVAAPFLARWDGSDWSSLGGGMDGAVEALAVYDGELVAGGSFSEAGGVAASRIASWDGEAWAPLDSGFNSTVYALAEHDGALFAGGAFRQAGTATVNRVARWDGAGWSALEGDGGAGVDDQVRSLAPYGDDLYVGGYFRAAGGEPVDHIARWDGSGWAPLAGDRGAGVGGVSRPLVTALHVFDADSDGPTPPKLAVGGSFQTAGGHAAWGLGLYGPTTPLTHLTVSPRELDFAAVPAGQTADPATVTLTATGNQPVAVTGVPAPEAPFHAAGGDCPDTPFTLAPMQSCTLGYEFAPATGGGYEQVLPLDSAGAPAAVALTGTGLAAPPAMEVGPENLAVELDAGQTGTHPVTIGNTGEAPLHWELVDTSFAPGQLPPAADPTTVSHSASMQVLPGHTIACYNQVTGHTRDGQYLRTFSLPDFDVHDELLVTEVTFGVQRIRAEAEVTVNLYTLDGDLSYANLDLLASQATTVDATQAGRLVTVPVRGVVPAGSTLVVELVTEDMLGDGWFVPGANDQGETARSYLASDTCGLPEPTPFANVGSGFPDVHLAMSVTGQQPVDCAPPSWLSAGPASGTTASGEQSEVGVSLDATGLAPGDHRALVCAEGDDPAGTFATVPVTLTVADDTGPVTCDRTITGVHPGPLTVTDGVTCLAAGAMVLGEVNVLDGAGLVATAAVVQGPLSAMGAAVVELTVTQVTGPVLVSGASGPVWLFANQVTGSVTLVNNHTGDAPATVSGNTIIGSLACFGNRPEPTHAGMPNTATAGKLGQCAGL